MQGSYLHLISKHSTSYNNSFNVVLIATCHLRWANWQVSRLLGKLKRDVHNFFACRKKKRKKYLNISSKRNRQRNVISWFNWSYNKNVKTNIACDFLDKHFSPSHTLNNVFNRGTVHIKCSCTDNMKPLLDKHNRTILKNHTNISERLKRRRKTLQLPTTRALSHWQELLDK